MEWKVLLSCLIKILLSKQMLDAIKRVVDDIVVFQQDSAQVHLAFNSPTVQNNQLSFS